MGLPPNPTPNTSSSTSPLQLVGLGEFLRELAELNLDTLRTPPVSTVSTAPRPTPAEMAKNIQNAGRIAIQIYDFLYVQLEPYVGSFYSDRVSFGNLDKELSRLLHTMTFASILEEGDDRIYVEGLMRSIARCQDRAGEILEQLADIGSLLTPAQLTNLSDVLQVLSQTMSSPMAALGATELAVRDAVEQIRAFVIDNEKVASKVRRFAVTLGSSNIRSVVEAELEPMRARGVKVAQSAADAYLPALLIAVFVGVFAAGAGYMMSIVPWWRPFTLWVLAIPVGTFFLARIVRRMRDDRKVNMIRTPFACVLYGADDAKQEIGRTPNNKKIFTPEYRLYQALAGRDFLSSPREYWEHQFPVPQASSDAKMIERDFLSRLGRDPYSPSARSMRGQGRSRPRGLIGAIRNSLVPFLISIAAAFVSAIVVLTLLGGQIFPFWLGLRGFEQPLAPMDSSLTAAIVGVGPNGSECVLGTGNIFWDGDLINIRPLGKAADGGPRTNELQTISRSAVRRIVYQRSPENPDHDRLPVEVAGLPDCISTPWAFTAPGVGLISPAPPTLPPIAMILNGEPVRLPQRTIILPFFSNPSKAETANAAFTDSALGSSSSALTPYMRILAEALGECGRKSDVVMDVVGFASDKDLDPSLTQEDNNVLNHALAEGRRRMVLGLIKELENPRLLVRNLQTDDAPKRIVDLDVTADWLGWSKRPNTMRFASFEEMSTRRDSVAKAAIYKGTAIQELFARSVIIEFESLGDCN